MGQGAFQGEESILADSGRAGEKSSLFGHPVPSGLQYVWLSVKGLARHCVGELIFPWMET